MEPRFLPDLTNTLEWNLVARADYTAVDNGNGTHTPIPPKAWIIENCNVLQIGVKSSQSLSSWYTGGWAAQRLLMVPSSTSEFTANVQTCNQRLRLGVLNLCEFPKYMPTWMLYLKLPRWFRQATVEIWRYDGRDFDTFNQGAIAANGSTIPQSATAIVLLAADPNRQGAIIMNEATAPLAIEFDAVPTMASHLVVLQPGGYFELPYSFKGQVQGIWSEAGSGFAKIREFF